MRAKKLVIGGITAALLAIGIPVASAATRYEVVAFQQTRTVKVCQYLVTRNAPIAVKDLQGKWAWAWAYKNSVANVSMIVSVNKKRVAAGNFYHRVVTRAPHSKAKVSYVYYNHGAIESKHLKDLNRCWRQAA
ncbi:MAG TPA: hypothetical protein VGR21_06605 [Cryptosporangiaceae bacterium]|nr:hypothetical protein [Cryptosporangiaceae bacterium]